MSWIGYDINHLHKSRTHDKFKSIVDSPFDSIIGSASSNPNHWGARATIGLSQSLFLPLSVTQSLTVTYPITTLLFRRRRSIASRTIALW